MLGISFSVINTLVLLLVNRLVNWSYSCLVNKTGEQKYISTGMFIIKAFLVAIHFLIAVLFSKYFSIEIILCVIFSLSLPIVLIFNGEDGTADVFLCNALLLLVPFTLIYLMLMNLIK